MHDLSRTFLTGTSCLCRQTKQSFGYQFPLVFPNLRCVVLDPLHVAIRYETSFARIRSLGSAILRKILCRFTAVVPDTMKKEPWADHPFVGLGTVPHTAEELFLTENVLGHCVIGAIPHCQAQSHLEKVNPNRPFLCRRDFVFALACVSSVHRNEMSKTGSSRKSLAQLFVNLSAAVLCLAVPCGTTNNEALHVELMVSFG